MAKTLRRPTKEMMLAVNASISGNKKKVNELVKEHRLSRRELEARLEIRDGEKYDLPKKGGRPKGSGKKTTKKRGPGRAPKAGRPGVTVEVTQMIDGRTKTVTLLRLAYKIEELLEERPKAEVQKIEKAFEEAEELKGKYEKAMQLIGEEPPI